MNIHKGFHHVETVIGLLLIMQTTHIFCAILPHSDRDDIKEYNFASSIRQLNYPLVDNELGISPNEVNRSLDFATDVVHRMQLLENNIGTSDVQLIQGTPAHAQLLEYNPNNKALQEGKLAVIALRATIHLMSTQCNRLQLDRDKCAKFMPNFNLESSNEYNDVCKKLLKVCTQEELNSKYRSMDGSCNNKMKGSIGQSFTSYKRLLFPDYLDGVNQPRRSVIRRFNLPSPRLISSTLVKHTETQDEEHTMALMQWSEFISHDFAHTAISKMVHSGKSIECCTSEGTKLSPRYVHPFCSPIAVPTDDQFYSKQNLECMSYVRSIPAVRPDCSLGPSEQMNQATHYLDGSQIYGSDEEKALSLRTLQGGLLQSSTFFEKEFLPVSKEPSKYCQTVDQKSCFDAGDGRVNSQPQLTVMHILWAREHNRIARKLQELNPQWNDEQLYQESRRIVIAELQHITYKDWLPNILAESFLTKILGFNNYNEAIDPSVSNSFATAAFRFVNSQMASDLNMYSEGRDMKDSLKLSEYFNKPYVVEEPGNLDALVRGLGTQSCEKTDFKYVQDVSELMYGNGSTGFDIISLDIQRGRDHGLPSYTAYRTRCGFAKVESFDDFADFIPSKIISSLSEVYKHPDDVDLLVGGMLEKRSGNSILGPTFSCIIADQFLRTRSGDRYFYTSKSQPKPFSEAQLEELYKVSLARIFCDNADEIKYMQPDVFKSISAKNRLVKCDSPDIPTVDLNKWRE